MSVLEFVVAAMALVILVYTIVIYNGLIRLKNNVERAFANIEVLLKQRHTELPLLVEVCKGYMKHEQQVLLAITEARSRVYSAQENHDVRGLGRAETLMRTSLSQLFARCEAYPDLKANENFLSLQERISQLEDAIADRREIFNESVRLNNTRIQQFPDVVLARGFGFGELTYLKFQTVDLLPVKVNLGNQASRL
jgi:LemA protein